MIDHLGINCEDIDASKRFYDTVLAVLGHTRVMEYADFVGYVHGAGNSRGEIAADPRHPLQAAETLGAEFFTRKYSDYRLETPRSHNVWASPPPADARRA